MSKTKKKQSKVNQLHYISTTMLSPDPAVLTRSEDPACDFELFTSVMQHNILEPLLVRKTENGQYLVVAGQRRLRAAIAIGLAEVPCLITTANPVVISAVENLQRKDFTAVEEARVYAELIETLELTHAELGVMVGKRQSCIAETLSINKLPQSIKDDAVSKKWIAKSFLNELAKIDDPELQVKFYQKYCQKELTRSDIRNESRKGKRDLEEILISELKSLRQKIQKTVTTDLVSQDFFNALWELQMTINEKMEQANIQSENYRHADNPEEYDDGLVDG